jgi:hypothetical protein
VEIALDRQFLPFVLFGCVVVEICCASYGANRAKKERTYNQVLSSGIDKL